MIEIDEAAVDLRITCAAVEARMAAHEPAAAYSAWFGRLKAAAADPNILWPRQRDIVSQAMAAHQPGTPRLSNLLRALIDAGIPPHTLGAILGSKQFQSYLVDR